jgi:hypothetical protein
LVIALFGVALVALAVGWFVASPCVEATVGEAAAVAAGFAVSFPVFEMMGVAVSVPPEAQAVRIVAKIVSNARILNVERRGRIVNIFPPDMTNSDLKTPDSYTGREKGNLLHHCMKMN